MSFYQLCQRLPHGPREILDDGKHGILVEVDNPNALAEGMMSAIRDKHNLDLIYKRSQDFRIDKANQYIEVFKEILKSIF